MTRKQWVMVLGLVMMVVGMACRHTSEITPKPLDKAAIEADIRSQIATHYPTETFDIGISAADDGTVTLTGDVKDKAQKDYIGRAAAGTSGVRRVINNIAVKP